MSEPIDVCLDRWHQHLKGNLDGALDAVLHPDCVFLSPIVFTSAIGQLREIELAMNAGADRYLVKPYEPDALLRTVKELINPAGELAFKS